MSMKEKIARARADGIPDYMIAQYYMHKATKDGIPKGAIQQALIKQGVQQSKPGPKSFPAKVPKKVPKTGLMLKAGVPKVDLGSHHRRNPYQGMLSPEQRQESLANIKNAMVLSGDIAGTALAPQVKIAQSAPWIMNLMKQGVNLGSRVFGAGMGSTVGEMAGSVTTNTKPDYLTEGLSGAGGELVGSTVAGAMGMPGKAFNLARKTFSKQTIKRATEEATQLYAKLKADGIGAQEAKRIVSMVWKAGPGLPMTITKELLKAETSKSTLRTLAKYGIKTQAHSIME